MKFEANCGTTAMGIMPHTDIDRALELALSLDVPFFPQLPKLSLYEDMYVQASEHFPGIVLDEAGERLGFSTARFEEEIGAYSELIEDHQALALSPRYSRAFHRFLEQNLKEYAAIRGQIIGPVSFGFKVVDEDARPLIYNDSARTILFDFLQRKANAQYRQLQAVNDNAFVWLDEPGLGWVFSGLSGYNDLQAKADYDAFLAGIEGPRGLHLCANVNLPYLLSLGLDILSFDAYALETMPSGYVRDVKAFIDKGGIISWGIVPTDSTSLDAESPASLTARLAGYWQKVAGETGGGVSQIARQALIAPARCCLKNTGLVSEEAAPVQACPVPGSTEERLVERAFDYLREMSHALRRKYL